MNVKELINSHENIQKTLKMVGGIDSNFHENTYVWENFWIEDDKENILYQGVYTGIPQEVLGRIPVSDISNVKTMVATKINDNDCVLGLVFNKIIVRSK